MEAEKVEAGRKWAAELVGKVVLHVPSGVAGTAKQYWSGEEGDRHRPPADVVARYGHAETRGPVLDVGGHTFTAGEDEWANFTPLSAAEERVRNLMRSAFSQSLAELARYAFSSGLARERFVLLLKSILREQLRVLA